MAHNPFSEADSQRYIAEFKSFPEQAVYAGFRATRPGSLHNVHCYGCKLRLNIDHCNFFLDHFRRSPHCPIALAIDRSQSEIEEQLKIDEEEILSTTLDQIARQSEVRRHQRDMAQASEVRKEYYLLHFPY